LKKINYLKQLDKIYTKSNLLTRHAFFLEWARIIPQKCCVAGHSHRIRARAPLPRANRARGFFAAFAYNLFS
jgi:hypothetical protein